MSEELVKPVERLFPFVLRARILLVGRDTQSLYAEMKAHRINQPAKG